MCEHEFGTFYRYWDTPLELDLEVCIKCLKTRSEIELETALAAANARVAELEAKWHENNKAHDKLMISLVTAGKGMADWKEIAEQAEAQCAKYHIALLKIKTWCSEPMSNNGDELQYVLDVAKSALEGKA